MPTSPTQTQHRAWQAKRRRAVGYLAMSAVLPGSVQLQTGATRVGRVALRVWFSLIAVGVILALGLLLWRGPAIALLLHPLFLLVARVLVWVVGLGWVALLIDSWRRADPMSQSQRTRLGLTITTGVLVAAMLGTTAVASNTLGAAVDVSSIFKGTGDGKTEHGRYNILLLGGDSGPTREGMRPDSIMVASIDEVTGRTVLFSLPRNMEGAPFPESNPLHKLYPKGYDCPESQCMLNGVYTLASDHKDLFPGVEDPGLQSMQDVVGTILGLKINYYALVDLAGFQSLIDAVGGVRLDIGRRIPIGGGSSKVSGYIEPGKNQLLDGYHALWFARSRHGSDDYDRMARQKCVLSAMAKQMDPVTVASKFGDLAAAGKGVLSTSVPTGDISKLIDLALLVKDQKIASVSFAPPLIHPGRPNFALIKAEVKKATAKSQALDAPATQTPAAPVTTTAAPTGTTEPQPTAEPTVQRETDDLESVCKVS